MGNLADLAWSLSQHPRARFAVCVNAGLDNHSGSAAVADTAAMLSGQAWRHAGAPGFEMLGGWGPVLCLPACHARLSQSSKGCACVSTPCPPAPPPSTGYDGFSWPANALLIAGFASAPPSDLAPVFGDRLARVEGRQAA